MIFTVWLLGALFSLIMFIKYFIVDYRYNKKNDVRVYRDGGEAGERRTSNFYGDRS